MKRPSRISYPLSLVLVITAMVAWVYRSRVERFLAPAESDYTRSSRLSASYPRPGADLTPIWKFDLEPGYGGAAIDDEEVFLLDREVGVADTLRVLELETGIEKWSYTYPAPGRLEFSGSRTTPVVVGNFIYTSGSFGQVHCIDRRTRSPVWSLDLERDCGGELPAFGWAASPLVHGELVILPALGPNVGLVAIDRFTGETVWKTAELGYSHSAPVLLELLGSVQVVFLSSEFQGLGSEGRAPMTVSAFDPSTGSMLWQVRTSLTSVPVPPPVRVDGEHFFLTGGYGGGSTLMSIRREAGAFAIEEVFHVDKGSQLHPPVVHEGHVYMLANENSNDSRRRRDRGGLICLDLSGNQLWSTGADPYFGRGHLMLLGDYLLVQDGLSGILRLCLASPRGFTQVATANVFESPPKANEKMWAPMARFGATLVVRGQSELRCVRLGDRAGEMHSEMASHR